MIDVQEDIFRIWQQVPQFPVDGWSVEWKELLFSKLGRAILSMAVPLCRPAPHTDWMAGPAWSLSQQARALRFDFLQGGP